MKRLQRNRPAIRRLEPRMMFDGAAVDTAAAVLDPALAGPATISDPSATDTTTTDTSTAPIDTNVPPTTDPTPAASLITVSSDPSHQIVVIDASVPYADDLIANVDPAWTVVRLTADRDGLTQLQELLANRSDLTAIHVFSHGSAGRITLGNLNLTTDNMASHSAELAALGSHLTADGDILLYGCNVAADFVGQQFVDQFAQLTQADIAASDDATGSTVVGGNWTLESQTGTVNTPALADEQYNATLSNLLMSTGLSQGTINFASTQNSPRLYWQASGAAGYGNTGDSAWVDNYNGGQSVSYWRMEQRSFDYISGFHWFGFTWSTAYYQWPVAASWNYGAGTRYATQEVDLTATSDYQFDVTASTVYKDNHGELQTNPGFVSLNTALYKGSFDPTDPWKNLVTASEGWLYGGQLQKGELAAGHYVVVTSFDTTRYVVPTDNNVWWSSLNNYAQQLWGNFTLTVKNLNSAPVWTTRDLSQTLDGSGVQSFTIPPALNGNITVSDADGDPLTITATLSNGNALPSWLTFDPVAMKFTGNPPANTGMLTIRLSANDGQLTSTRDFTVTYTHDNDQPVVAALIPDQAWDGAGSFSYTIPAGTFTDSDPSGTAFTYTATLADGSALPHWLTFNAGNRTLSGNPPANFAGFDIKITVNDGTGQANATQSDTFHLTLSNNNDIPTVSNIAKSLVEDNTLSFSAADFTYSDTDTYATNDTITGSGRTIQSIRILSLPANGSLWLDTNGNGTQDSGETVVANQVIAYASLGLLRYTPRADWAGGTPTGTTHTDLNTTPDRFTWTATDGVNDAAAPATTSINVSLVNDAPVLNLSDGRALIIRPNTGNDLATPVLVDPAIQVTDADAAFTSDTAFDTIYGATVSVTDSVINTFQSGDILAATASNGITVSYNSATGVLTLTSAAGAKAADYQSVLRTLSFKSTNTTNDNLREVSITLRTADVGSKTSVVLDGVNDYVDTQRDSIPVTGDYTVSVWARLDVAAASVPDGGQYTILAQGSASGNNFFIMLNRVGSNYNLRLGDGWTITNGFPMDGKWHQFTVVKNGNATSNGTLYIDGVKTATGNLSSVDGTSLRIGRLYRPTDTTEYDAYWKGAISDLRIYDRTLNLAEISTSLDSSASLSGYEANLVAWYPLISDYDNHAVTTWDFGRDYNPYNPSISQGPWSMGVVTGDNGATGNFNATAFQALTADTAKITTTDKYVQYDNAYYPYYNSYNGWGRIQLTNNTVEHLSDWNLEPGVVTLLPGTVNPAALQFAAPVAGVYSIDARFWSSFASGSPASWPIYKIFRVAANGTVTELAGAGGTVTGNLAKDAAVSGLRQVVLNAGEKLVFAVHKGDAGSVNGDEVKALIRCDLLAIQTSSGNYYSLEDGHYYGISSGTATWDAANTAAAGLTAAGQSGYLATPTSSVATRIAAAIVQESGQTQAWAGFKQIGSAAETTAALKASGWFWAAGPEANTPFDGQWAASQPDDYGGLEDYGIVYNTGTFNDNNGASSFRYLVEYGTGRLAPPAELTNLSATRDPGNAMVYKDAGVAWSARTGHYYQLTSTSSDFTAANGASYTYAGQSGYLSRLASLNETDLAAYMLRLGGASGAWVGLQSTDPNSNGQLVWKWNSGSSGATVLDPSASRTDVGTTVPAGQTLIAYDDFQSGSSTGWVYNSDGSNVSQTTDGLTTADGTANRVAGLFGGGWIKKSYAINNQATTISFILNRNDSWDGENFYLQLRNESGNGSNYDQFQFPLIYNTNYSSISPTFTNTGTTTSSARLAQGNVTITPIANYGNFTGSSWQDQSFRVTVRLAANYGNSITLYLGSGLDQATNDESWTIDNVALYQAASTANTNTGVGGTLDTFTSGTVTGWDASNLFDGASNNWSSFTTISGDRALWFCGGNPTKTFVINNDATRVEFDLYTLDSWDNENFGAYINRSQVFSFSRNVWTNITSAWSGTAMINGKVVSYTVTPGTYGEFYGNSGWPEQKFHAVIDLPEDFGTSFELGFDDNLNEGAANESAAIDNVQVYSRDNAGWIDSRGMLTADNNAAINPLRLDQFNSINLYDNGWATDNWEDIKALATDGKFIYAYYPTINRIYAYDMNGVVQTKITIDPAVLGNEEVQMASSGGWLYIRKPGATISAGTTDSNVADDRIYRVSPVDGSTTLVSVDNNYGLLGGLGWATGSLFNMPDGRLGIVSTVYSTGATTVRLYNLADNGTRLVWSQDYTLNVGAGWLSDSHGTTSDGRYLYILRYVSTTDKEYKVFDLTTGALAIDGTPYNLYQQAVDNATHLTRDPLTGDIYFADFAGSHIARVQQPASAQRLSLVEYGAEGTALAAPLFVTELSSLPDRFVTDSRSVQVRVGNTAPTVSAIAASTVEDTALTLTRAQFANAFTDPELDALYSITLQTVPAAGAGTLSLNGTTLAANAVIFAGDLDRLVFTPTANFNGSASFTYKASDGNLTSSAAATVTLTVTAVNDAPVLNTAGSPTLTGINEDDVTNTGTTVAALVIDASITDADVTSGSAPEAIAVTRVDNTHGVWQYKVGNGIWTVFTNTTGRLVDLGASARLLDSTDSVRFVPAADWNGSANISYRAWDKTAGTAGGTTNPNAQGGNLAVSAAEETASITVSAVNDTPTTASASIDALEDADYVFTAANFAFADVDTGNSLQAVAITTRPDRGTLKLNGVDVTANQSIAIADITAGNLKFRGAANAFGSPYTTIGFTVSDGTTNSAAATLTINLADTNDAPTAIAWKVVNSVAEGRVPENSAAGTVVGHLLGTDPNSGDTLRFQGVSNSNFSVAPDGTVTVSSLATLDYESTPTQTLRVRITDSGGLSYEQDVTVTLTDVVETAPSLIVNALYIAKGASTVISASQLNATDAQQTASQLTYTVKEAGAGGTWWLDLNGNGVLNSGEELAPHSDAAPDALNTFTQADVAAGKLHFTKDGTQTNSKLVLDLSDGSNTVSGTLVAITNSPPEVAAVPDQTWSTSGAQTFKMPANTFTDPDMDVVTVTATLSDGSALPSWLHFDASTWTFSGNPADGSMADGSHVDLKISGTDGRATVNDIFRVNFTTTLTNPVVANPIANQVFDGSGSKSFTVPANTFTARGNNAIASYSASNLPAWLSFDANTQTFSGNPPQSAEPGPYWITVTATATDNTTTSTVFRLVVTNANDLPTYSTGIANQTISDANTHTWSISPTTTFTDGDADTLTLRAGKTDGSELPSWVHFDPTSGTFSAKAPAGNGTLTVRVFADDGKGGTGYRDFTITYSGGVNEAPKVMTGEGLYFMDNDGVLKLDTGVKAQVFSISQGTSGTITDSHLKEADPDDDGTGLTYTLKRLPTHGQLWLDTDGDGTLNGTEAALRVGDTFTQADIDAGKLHYRDTDTSDIGSLTTVTDSFLFDLADGGENSAAPMRGAEFIIKITPAPAAATLINVLRSTPSTQLTNADSVSFEVDFSAGVRNVDTNDFVVTNGSNSTALGGNIAVTSVSAISSSRYVVTVGGSDLAGYTGTLGLQLKSAFSIERRSDGTSVDTNQLTGLSANESYTLDNTGPVATLAGPALYAGTSYFWVTLDFGSDAVNDLTLADLSVSTGNATLSGLERIGLDSNSQPIYPDAPQPAGYNPQTYVTPTLSGNLYCVKVTPTTNTGDITVALAAAGVTDAAGNGNGATSVTIARNSAPTVMLDAAGTPAANNSATFTERDGADNGSRAIAFTTAGTTLADANASQNLAWLKVAIPASQITDGAAETLRVAGATSGGSIALNFADGAAMSNVVLNGVTYSVTASVLGGGALETPNNSSGWYEKTTNSAWNSFATVEGNSALWFTDGNPSKTFVIDNRATRIEFDAYAIDSWGPGGEQFSAKINGTTVFGFDRDMSTQIGNTLSGTATINGKTVSYTVTPGTYGSIFNGGNNDSWQDQRFHVVIDLPLDFGSNFELTFHTNLNESLSNESAAVTNVLVASGTRSLTFAKSGGGTLTLAEAETLLDALRYNNASDTPTAASRAFAVTVNDGMETSTAATFTVTVAATNDTPVVTVGSSDRDSAALTETNAKLTASGTLTVADRDLGGTVAANTASVVASGTRGAFAVTDDTALLAMLTVDSSNVIGTSATTGTIHWAFDSGNEAFNYLAAGETLTLTYTVRATDNASSPAHADQTVVVTITGSNDGPAVTASSVTALSPTTMTASGTITAADPDASNSLTGSKANPTITATLPGGGNVTLSTSSVTAINAALSLTTTTPSTNPGDVAWSFNLDPATLKTNFTDAGVVTVDSFEVDEGNDAIWHITYAGATTLNLALGGTATSGSDYTALEYSLDNGTHWNAYSQNIAVSAPGSLLARVATVADGVTDPDETIELKVTSASGSIVTGTATIKEVPAATFSINSFDVNEGSYALWTIRATLGDYLDLSVGGAAATATAADYSILEISLDNGANWHQYAGAETVTDPNGIMLARTQVISDGSADAGETIILSVTDGIATLDGTATIREGSLNLSAGTRVSISYPITVSDGQLSTQQNLDFKVISNGNGGSLVVSGDTGSIVEGSPSTLSDAGSLTFDGYPSFASVSVGTSPSIIASSLTLTTSQIDAIKAGFAASYIDNATTDAANWTYSITESALDFLPANETVTAVFTVKIYGSATPPNLLASQNVTIVILGTNDAPVVTSTTADAEGSVTENAVTNTVTHTLTASDKDAGATKTWSGNATGTYGSLAINASTGEWTYTLDNSDIDTQALAAGQTAVETFTATVTDNRNATATQQIRVTVAGANDAPVLTAPGTVATYTDTGTYDTFSAVTGTLSATDPDSGTPTYAISGQSADTSLSGYTHSLTGSYGKLYLNALTGAYKYAPNAAKMNAATATVYDNFTVQATDSSGATSNTATLSVTIDGVNDTPTLSTRARSASVTSDLYETDGGLSTGGTLVAGEVDTSQTLTIDVPTATAQLNSGTVNAMDSTQLGWLTWTTSAPSGTTQPIQWTFNSGSEAFNSLRAGDTLTLTYTVRVSDGSGGSTSMPVTVIVHGTNDAPVISIDATGTADSAAAGITETNAANRTASGTLTVADAEAGDTLTASVTDVAVSGTAPRSAAPSDATLLAMLGLTPTSLLTDSTATLDTHGLAWNFDSGSETFDKLAAGQTLVLTYTVRVTDNATGAPGMDTQTVTITLTGANDAPVITYDATTSGKSATVGDDHIADALQGFIASGFPDKLFDSGSVSFTDIDLSDTPTATKSTVSITGALRNGAPGSLTLSSAQQTAIASAFTLTPAAGNTNDGTVAWNYIINQSAIDFLGSGQSVTAVFRITVADGHGGNATQDVTVTIAGKNNAPDITVTGSNSAAEALTETNAGLSTTGTLTVTDTNLTDTVTATVLSGTVQRNTDTAAAMANGSAYLNWLSLGSSPVLSGTNRSLASGALTWTFNSGSEAFNDLVAGETLTLVYTVEVTDDAPTSASDTQTITLTITGTNDAPTVAAALTSVKSEGDSAYALNLLAGAGDLDLGEAAGLSVANVTYAINGGTPGSSIPAGLSRSGATLTVDPAASAFDALAVGESAAIVVSYDVTDAQGASIAQTQTITINGTNDAPTVVAPLSATVAEGNSVFLGDLLFGASDLDHGETASLSIANVTYAVDGGMTNSAAPDGVSVIGTTLRLDPASPLFDHLAVGEVMTITIHYNVTDAQNAIVAQTTTVTIVGTNDAPTISYALTSSVAEGASLYTLNLVAGASDLDHNETASLSLTNVRYTVDGGLPNNTVPAGISLSGTTLSVDPTDSAFDYLAAGESTTITVDYKVTDVQGVWVSQSETLTIQGTNDAPEISLVGSDSAAELLAESNTGLSTGGTLSVSDLDRSDTVSVSRTSVVASGTTAGLVQDNSALLAMLTVDSGNIIGNAATNGSIHWAFDSGSEAFDYLAAGETLTLTYTLQVTDSSSAPASAERTVVVTIQGTNDAPVRIGTPFVDQRTTVGNLYTWTVPAGDFADVDHLDIRSFTATLANGSPLPAWLSFDPATLSLSGTPTTNEYMGLLVIRITVTDTRGATVSADLALDVLPAPPPPLPSDPPPPSPLFVPPPSAPSEPVSTSEPQPLVFASAQVGGGTVTAATLDSSRLPADGGSAVFGGIASIQERQLLSATGDVLQANAPVRNAEFDIGSRIVVQLAADTFSHTNPKATVTLSASMADGKALPDWLVFQPSAARFEGIPPTGYRGAMLIRVVARDQFGNMAVQTFKIEIGAAGQTAIELPPERPAKPLPPPRTGLSEQFQLATRHALRPHLATLARHAPVSLERHKA